MSFFLYSKGKKIDDKVLLDSFFPEAISVFESLRTYGGKVFRQEEHLSRFMESARTAGREREVKPAQLNEEINLALKAFQKENPADAQQDLFIRITLLPEHAGKSRILVMIGRRAHPPDLYKKGVMLRTSPVRRSLANASPPQAKTSAYQNAVLATLEPSQGVYEWLFLDHTGFVTEVRIGNLFMAKDGVLFTPPTTGILNGVTRRFVLKCAGVLKLSVREVPLTRHEIFTADEAFLTNTSWEILPVRELDGRLIGKKIPGALTLKLQKTFKHRIGKNPT